MSFLLFVIGMVMFFLLLTAMFFNSSFFSAFFFPGGIGFFEYTVSTDAPIGDGRLGSSRTDFNQHRL